MDNGTTAAIKYPFPRDFPPVQHVLNTAVSTLQRIADEASAGVAALQRLWIQNPLPFPDPIMGTRGQLDPSAGPSPQTTPLSPGSFGQPEQVMAPGSAAAGTPTNIAQVFETAIQLLQQASTTSGSLDPETLVRGRVQAARACGLAIGAMAALGQIDGTMLQQTLTSKGDPYALISTLIRQLHSPETRLSMSDVWEWIKAAHGAICQTC